jgi:hypothetical protein
LAHFAVDKGLAPTQFSKNAKLSPRYNRRITKVRLAPPAFHRDESNVQIRVDFTKVRVSESRWLSGYHRRISEVLLATLAPPAFHCDEMSAAAFAAVFEELIL